MLDCALSAIMLQLIEFVSMKTVLKIKFIFFVMDVAKIKKSENMPLKFIKLMHSLFHSASFLLIAQTNKKS